MARGVPMADTRSGVRKPMQIDMMSLDVTLHRRRQVQNLDTGQRAQFSDMIVGSKEVLRPNEMNIVLARQGIGIILDAVSQRYHQQSDMMVRNLALDHPDFRIGDAPRLAPYPIRRRFIDSIVEARLG